MINSSSSSSTAAGDMLSYICEICGCIIEDLNNLKLHLKNHTKTLSPNTDNDCLLFQEKDKDVKILTNNSIPILSPINNNNNNVVCQQPYRFVDDKNHYSCNLCEYTYDSLRSMKAHIWKHSGHHDISYPMKELIIETSNDVEQTSSILKIENEEIITGNEVTIVESSSINSSPFKSTHISSPSSSSNSSSRSTTGICSVLLEVIEKLRQNEETVSNNEETKDKKSKRGRKRKVNELISEKELLLKLNSKTREKAAATPANPIINNNENINKNFLNNKKQQLNYLCIKCKKHFLNKINLETHTNNSTCMETEITLITKPNDDDDDDDNGVEEFEIIYACNTCDFKCLIKENLIDHIKKIT